MSATGKKLPDKLIFLSEALKLSREEINKLHKKHLNASLATIMELLNFDRHFVRARDTRVWDSEGREYLDFLGGFGSLNIGHNHPAVLKALKIVEEMPNILQTSLPALPGALAANLAAITPGKLQRSFFCNSGAEAVEGALKLSRIATGREQFIYCHNSFHGKTFGALSVTGREKYQKPFQPLLPQCIAVPYGDLRALEEVLQARRAAAFIVEPIQGEGGVNLPPPGYLPKARELCRKYGTLFIADEVQTGLGRTGYMFACEHEEVEPDIICLAKSLGGGVVPLGAFITTDEIWKKAYGSLENALLHTSTFANNTRAAAAALATLEVICSEDLPRQALEKGNYLIEKLNQLKEKYPLVKDVRGRGLLVGIELQPGTSAQKIPLVQKLSDEYMGSMVAGELLNKYAIITAYTINNPNVIRLEPPLTVSYEQLDRLVNALNDIFSRYRSFFSIATASAKTMIKNWSGKKL